MSLVFASFVIVSLLLALSVASAYNLSKLPKIQTNSIIMYVRATNFLLIILFGLALYNLYAMSILP